MNPTFGDVILLTNSDRGQQLEHRRTEWTSSSANGWFASGSYLYGQANVDQRRDQQQARSTWINVYTAGDINNPPLGRSNFDVRHRIVLTGSYLFDHEDVRVTLSMFYNGQTGRPYSYNFGSDVNVDGATTNDLLFYPRDGDVTFTTGTYQDLADFLEAGNCTDVVPGAIVDAQHLPNAVDQRLDFHAAVNVASEGSSRSSRSTSST